MIYFMQSTEGGPIKIGHSKDVPARNRALESHYQTPMAILATMEGGRDEERAIHARFGHLRLGLTEQFRPAPDLMAFIGRPLLVSPNPEAVEVMPGPTGPKTIGIRSSAEWAAWLDRAVRHCRTDIAKFLDTAAAEYAKSRGFDEPPPERVP